jgi:hypothetical protein
MEDHPEWLTANGYELPENFDELLEEELANGVDTYAADWFMDVCYDNRSSREYEVQKHMNKGGNSDVCTASKESRNHS